VLRTLNYPMPPFNPGFYSGRNDREKLEEGPVD
jgi:hypothetical protein